MPRIKRSVPARRRHKKILNLAKGFRMTHRTLFRPANEAVMHALEYAYRDRRARIESATDPKTLEALRVSLLGKKGELTTILRQLGSLPTAERAASGAEANQLKEEIFQWIAERMGGLEAKRHVALGETEWVDL